MGILISKHQVRQQLNQHKQRKIRKKISKNKIKNQLSGQIQLNSQFERLNILIHWCPVKIMLYYHDSFIFLRDIESMNNHSGTDGFSTTLYNIYISFIHSFIDSFMYHFDDDSSPKIHNKRSMLWNTFCLWMAFEYSWNFFFFVRQKKNLMHPSYRINQYLVWEMEH